MKRSPKTVASVSSDKSKQKSGGADTLPLTIDSKIGDLIADERSKAILDKHMPGMSTSPQIGMAKGMPLKAMAPMSGGKITPEMLKAVEEDLKTLSPPEESGSRKKVIVPMMMTMFAAVFFFVGFAMAIVAGIWWPNNEVILGILLVLGLLMGLLSYKTGEVMPFLLAAVTIIVIGTTQPFNPVGTLGEEFVANINDVVATMAVFIAPATVIQAIRGGIALIHPGIDGIKMVKAYREMKKMEEAAQSQE